MSEIYEIGSKKYLRETLPSSPATEAAMVADGWFFADRTLKVSVPLAKVTQDLKFYQRLPIVETLDYKDDIFRIAHESFAYDRRFHVARECNREISAAVLRNWVNGLGHTLVALYHDKPVGFLNLKENEVYLAACEEKYRITGAAMGLYARAIELCRERGFQTMIGRVSTLNTAVMNVYANFGATFAEPQDVFLKEET